MTQFFQQYFQYIIFGLQFVIGAIFWAARKAFVTQADFARIVDRVTAVEGVVRDLPDIESIHKLGLQISELQGDLKGFNTRFDMMKVLSDRMQNQVDRIDTFLKRV